MGENKENKTILDTHVKELKPPPEETRPSTRIREANKNKKDN